MTHRADWIFATFLYVTLLLALIFLVRLPWLAALPLSFVGFVSHNYFLGMFGNDDIHEEHAGSVRSAIVDHLFAFAPMFLLCGLIAILGRGA